MPARAGQFVERVSVIVAYRRFNPFALVIGKVIERHTAAERVGFGHDRLGNLTFVKAVAAVLLQQAKSLREVWIAKYLAGDGLFSVDVPSCH